MGEHLTLVSPKLLGRLVVTRSRGNDLLLPLPFGALRRTDGVTLEIDLDDRNAPVRATARKSSHDETTILPVYRETDELSVAEVGKVAIDVFEINHDVERYEALGVVTRSHYLNAPSRGLILGCRFVDAGQQQAVRNQAPKIDRWSPAWTDRPQRVIACLMIDHLYHGYPKGRIELLKAARKGNRKLARLAGGDLSRSEFVEEVGVAWINRIAVDAPYRGIGLGTLLARHARVVARTRMYPPAAFLEVMTTFEAAVAKERAATNADDFLTRAGFSRVPGTRPSRRLVHIDSDGDRTQLLSAKKLYYYAPTLDALHP